MSYNPMPPLGQAVMASSLPVVIASNQSAIPVSQSGTWNVGTVTTVTNLAQLGGAAISMNTGVRDAGTQRVTIATNDSVPVTIAAALDVSDRAGRLLGIVDKGKIWDGTNIAAVKAASTAAVATDPALVVVISPNNTIAATQSGTWNVGTVTTVTAVSTVTSLTQMNGQAIAMGTGVRSAGTQRVTIATDDVVPCSQSGTWNIGTVTTLPALPANQSVNLAQVAGTTTDTNSGNKSAGTLRMVLATDQPALTNSLNVKLPNAASGTLAITAIDAVVAAPGNDGLVKTGASTAGSIAAQAVTDGQTTWRVQLTGTFTTTVYFEGSLDSSNGTDGNWISLEGRQEGKTATTVGFSTATASTQWVGSLAGCTYFRVRAVGGAITALNAKIQLSNGNAVSVQNGAIPAGSNIVGQVGIDQTTPGTTNAVVDTPATPTQSNTNSAGTTNATSVKGSAATLYGIVASNINAAIRYLKLYNKATAPTVGTDIPVMTLAIPATGVLSVNLGTLGARFTTGLAFAITTLGTDADATAVAAGEIKVSLAYL